MYDTRRGFGMLRRLTAIGAALIVTLGCGTTTFAHPGHGTIPPEQPAHYLEPGRVAQRVEHGRELELVYGWVMGLSQGGLWRQL